MSSHICRMAFQCLLLLEACEHLTDHLSEGYLARAAAVLCDMPDHLFSAAQRSTIGDDIFVPLPFPWLEPPGPNH